MNRRSFFALFAAPYLVRLLPAPRIITGVCLEYPLLVARDDHLTYLGLPWTWSREVPQGRAYLVRR